MFARRITPVALTMLFVAFGGCGGGGGSVHVRRTAGQRPDVDPAMTTRGALAVPKSAAFNISSFQSGQTGDARGDARPIGADGAVCESRARDGGTAWGEFQIGYCFDNVTGRALQAAVKLRMKVDETNTGADAAATQEGAGNTATTSLQFAVRDTNGLLVKSENLLAGRLERGASSAAALHDRVFDVRFEPDRGYYLVIGGRTDLQSAPGGAEATSALEVRDVSIEIVWQGEAPARTSPPQAAPPPPVQTTGSP